jgi:hypothetical protein
MGFMVEKQLETAETLVTNGVSAGLSEHSTLCYGRHHSFSDGLEFIPIFFRVSGVEV